MRCYDARDCQEEGFCPEQEAELQEQDFGRLTKATKHPPFGAGVRRTQHHTDALPPSPRLQSAGGWKLERRNMPRKEKSTTLGAYSSPEQLKSAVLHDGYHDATLGLTPPDFATLGAQTGSAPTEVLLAVLGAHQTATLWCSNMCHPWRPTSMMATSENLAGKRQRTCF